MKKVLVGLLLLSIHANTLLAQRKWVNADSAFQPLPANFHVYSSTDSLDGKPFIAYYAEARLKDKDLNFTADTTRDRRITPRQFYFKNRQPLLVVNCTFFSYETNRSLNVVIKNGRTVAFNTHTIPMKGKDTFQYKHPLGSAIGIDKKRNADVAWLYTDSLKPVAYARQWVVPSYKDSSLSFPSYNISKNMIAVPAEVAARHGDNYNLHLEKWKMKTAVGGGPVLLQNGEIKITNNEELKFTGKAIEDKHPRTCMGYTSDGRLIVMVIQGRFPGIAEGATLTQEAQLLKDLGCVEALNLDGGGSSCMLINGKETITPSDKVGERPVPAVFIIK
ncbi:phosphodiester glycosidase family protein [Ferruginibacter profundus]